MPHRLTTVSRLLLVFFLIAASFLLLSCNSSDNDPSIPELTILTPHGSDIRLEFEKAFTAWHQQKYHSPVRLRWPDIGGGGTGVIIHYLDPLYASGNTSGYDVIWGGGSFVFDNFRQRGYLEKPKLPPEVLNQVPPDIFGTPLHGKDDQWIAATLSNFGIVINKQRIAELHMTTPTVWADLADAQWFNNLSLTDPSKSGSVLTSYNMIFAQYGWEKGWALMTRIFANAALIRSSGADPADDVGSASAIAGIVIDFYGRKHIIRVGSSIVGFVIPKGGSTIDADPIAVLRGAPHADLAAHFIEFVISPEGQRLWTYQRGIPGGPDRYVLGRMSVLPELYENESENMFEPTFPFTRAKPLKLDPKEQAYRSIFLGDLIKSTLVDNHDLLVQTRAAIKNAGDPPDLLAVLDSLPSFTPTTLNPAADDLIPDSQRPITTDQLPILADEFKPSSTSSKSLFTDRLQARLKEQWELQYQARLTDLLNKANSHH